MSGKGAYTSVVAKVFPALAPPELLLDDEELMITSLGERGASAPLEFGCGYGRFVAHMQKVMPRAMGIDRSADMVNRAAELSELTLAEGSIVTGDMLDPDSWPTSFDSVVSSDATIALLPDRESVQRLVHSVSDRLESGGCLMFTFVANSTLTPVRGLELSAPIPIEDGGSVVVGDAVLESDEESVTFWKQVDLFDASGEHLCSDRALTRRLIMSSQWVRDVFVDAGFLDIVLHDFGDRIVVEGGV